MLTTESLFPTNYISLRKQVAQDSRKLFIYTWSPCNLPNFSVNLCTDYSDYLLLLWNLFVACRNVYDSWERLSLHCNSFVTVRPAFNLSCNMHWIKRKCKLRDIVHRKNFLEIFTPSRNQETCRNLVSLTQLSYTGANFDWKLDESQWKIYIKAPTSCPAFLQNRIQFWKTAQSQNLFCKLNIYILDT